MFNRFILIAILTLFYPIFGVADQVLSCKALAQAIKSSDKKFPVNEIRNIRSIVIWTASRCERPPKGDGKVVQLCDAELTSGGAIIYWKKIARRQKIVTGYIVCKH